MVVTSGDVSDDGVGVQRRLKKVKDIVMEGDKTLGGEHRTECKDVL